MLVSDAGKASLERLIRKQVADLVLAVQFMGHFVDDGVVIIDDRLQVVVGQGVLDDDISVLAVVLKVFFSQLHD